MGRYDCRGHWTSKIGQTDPWTYGTMWALYPQILQPGWSMWHCENHGESAENPWTFQDSRGDLGHQRPGDAGARGPKPLKWEWKLHIENCTFAHPPLLPSTFPAFYILASCSQTLTPPMDTKTHGHCHRPCINPAYRLPLAKPGNAGGSLGK